tara:strand:- start:19 stop:849 length:831 start_codon:yes stop_codon:yes gene_type:complete
MLGLGSRVSKGGILSTGFVDPSSIASLRIWYKHDTGMSTAAGETSAAGDIDNGDQIIQWSDQSGQDNHATQSTGTDCPKYNNGGATDGSLHFATNSKWFDLTSALDIAENEDFTFAMQVKFQDNNSRGLFGHDGSNFLTRESASTFRVLISDSAQNNFTEASDTVDGNGTFGSAGYYSIILIRSGGASPVLKLYVDNTNNGNDYSNKQWGDTNGKNSAGAVNSSGDGDQFDISNLGCKADDAGELKGWMRHFSYYNEAISDSDRASLFTYMSNIGS